eukprot:g15145.t1
MISRVIFIIALLVLPHVVLSSPLRGIQPEQLVVRKKIADDEGGTPVSSDGKAPGGNSNSTETVIPRESLDTQTPEVAEVVSYAMTFINKQVEPKRLARVINIVNAFREKRTATDKTGYYTATLQLRRANGRIEFQDIKVGRNLESGSLASCTHKLRSSAFSMRTRNFGELVSVKPVGGNKNS